MALANGANNLTSVVQFISGPLVTNIASRQLPVSVVYLYDQNGNLTNDGLRSFAYDDENQLVTVWEANTYSNAFVYDGLGRRRTLLQYTWIGGSPVLTNQVNFVYDGNLVLQERDGNNNPMVTYTRGLDMGGGIGGLLARTDAKGSVFYHSDACGDITALIDRYQTLDARYLYDPFGNLLNASGPLAGANTYRFSSKELDPNSGLYYFGERFYDPNLQRFINRDPSGENGGINLYAFTGNNPVNSVDPDGLSWFSDFGDFEQNLQDRLKRFFMGSPCDYHLDPNSIQYLSNSAGFGVTPFADKMES